MSERPAPPAIFSRERRIAALDRARQRQGRTNAARYILDDMVADIIDRLEFMRFSPARVLIIGDWTGTLALSLGGNGAAVREESVATIDEEQPLPGAPYDLVVSLASMERVNDLPGALLHARAALAPDGIFLASIIGAGSLGALRAAMIDAEPERPAARMHPLIDTPSASALMQRAGFARQVVDSRTLTVAYPSLGRLVGDLRDQALGNVLRDRPPPLDRAALARAEASFLARAGKHGSVAESFEILTLTGWKD